MGEDEHLEAAYEDRVNRQDLFDEEEYDEADLCLHCRGTGERVNANLDPYECGRCGGTGLA